MGSAARPVTVTPAQVAELVGRGVEAGEIVRLLVATGTWSESGAAEIVATLASGADDAKQNSMRADLGWPGPADDHPPLFAA